MGGFLRAVLRAALARSAAIFMRKSHQAGGASSRQFKSLSGRMARFQHTVFENEHPLGDAPPLAVPTLNIQLRCGRTRRRINLCVGMIIRKNRSNRLAEACVHRAAADGAVVEEVPSARRRSHHCRCRNTHFCVGPLQT